MKNLRAELKESKMKTKDEGGKGINISSTQLDISTQDTPQDKNTVPNNALWTPKEKNSWPESNQRSREKIFS